MKIKIKYGSGHFQFGDLYLPEANCIGTVCLLHGGFWTMPFGLDQFDGIATQLFKLGYCVWNIEYRRIGEKQYNWKNAFEDSVNAVNELENIRKLYNQINLSKVFVAGHSAGGHLAVWLNSQELKISVTKFIGLSPLLDLELAYQKNSGNGSVEKFLQGKPEEFPERYLFGSPIKLHKKESAELIIHGNRDEQIPIEWSKQYHEKVKQVTDKSQLIELEKCGHMDFIDPKSEAFEILKSNLI